MGKSCKDCSSTTRPLKYPGPRCFTCWRDELKRRKAANHDRTVQQTYGLGPGDYDRLYQIQGGYCAICQRARGITKRLAVDHDHQSGEVRGLLCGPCNKLIGQARDNPEFFSRAYRYLKDPPARKLNG